MHTIRRDRKLQENPAQQKDLKIQRVVRTGFPIRTEEGTVGKMLMVEFGVLLDPTLVLRVTPTADLIGMSNILVDDMTMSTQAVGADRI
jgi:hypothetical protein